MILGIFLLPIFIQLERIQSNENNLNRSLRSSWGRELLTPFIIDDSGGGDYTWEEAINESWCSGNGTFTNPYVISNLEINCHANAHCIEIKNSNVFFIIESCKLYSSSGNSGYYRFFPSLMPSKWESSFLSF